MDLRVTDRAVMDWIHLDQERGYLLYAR